MTDNVVEVSSTVVTKGDTINIDTSPNLFVPTIVDTESIVEVTKKEYSVVGDGLYASVTAEQAPAWLTSIIDTTVSTGLSNGLQDLNTAISSINTAIDEVEVAKNEYQQLINIDATVEASVVSNLASLNSTVDQNTAGILTLETTKVTPTEASSIAVQELNSALGATGSIGAEILRIDSSVTALNDATAISLETLTSAYESTNTELAGVANATSILNTYVGLDTDGNPDGTGLLATASDVTQLEIDLANEVTNRVTADSTVTNNLTGYIDSSVADVRSEWSYNSTIEINGQYYSSGFGINTSGTTGGTGTNIDPFTSEFWINAEKFKFTNSGVTGSVAPFTIDASGTTPQIAFNGTVDFSVLGIPGTTTIAGDNINTGSINLNSLSSFIVPLNYSGTVVDSSGVSVYDNGTLRVRLGSIV